MQYVLTNAWALLLGIFMLQIGNGLQGTLLAVRGASEGFDPSLMSLVMTGYFIGFLGGSWLTPHMIRRVGHVRVFAALASFISAGFVLYPALPDPIAWVLLRMLIGMCFAGVYVAAESWLNDVSTNATRGKVISAYIIVQMLGIMGAQILLNAGDPNGYFLFVVISVTVSLSFGPILLSVSPVPAFSQTKPLGFRKLYETSPLGVVGLGLHGCVNGAMYGMAAVYATARGMSLPETSLFLFTMYLGGLLMQFPVGYLSDRLDRRVLILTLTALGAVLLGFGTKFGDNMNTQLAMGFVMGAVATPLYALLIAYTNDYLEPDDMAAAAGGLIFINGAGAITGPLIAGEMMRRFGVDAYFSFVAAMLGAIGLYAAYRMTQRPAPSADETLSYTVITPGATSIALEITQEETAEEAEALTEENSEREEAQSTS